MPRSADLPEDLKSLTRRQAIDVSHERFGSDSERLIEAVERAFTEAAAKEPLTADWRQRVDDCLKAGNYTEAVRLLEPAAERGDADALDKLGFAYEYGRGASRDYAKAREYYQAAAAGGHVAAMYHLGLLYRQAGPRQDIYQAQEWLRKAVAKGDVNAKQALEELRQNRPGVL